jgi:glycosyltransferase involved in cell wall biosynthesis
MGLMDLSVVIPVKDEADNIAPLFEEIRVSLDGIVDYEVLFIDDGSKDATAAKVSQLPGDRPRWRLLRHATSCGQSAAIRTGVKAAQGAWIATLDGDGQNDPADIPKLLQFARASSPSSPVLVAGYRQNRQDSWWKCSASRIANSVRGRLLGDDTLDTGCGLKLFPRSLFLDLPYFDHMHRFLPALALREGGIVHSVPVNHRPRRSGISKYAVLDRLGVGIIDLFGVMWLQRRAARPHLLDEMPASAEKAPRSLVT